MSDETKMESVYERARKALVDGFYGIMNPGPYRIISAAITAGEAAEKRAHDWEQESLQYEKNSDSWRNRAKIAERELCEWKTASENQIRVAPGQPCPNPEANEVRACMAEGLAAARRGHFELISRSEEASKRAEEAEARVKVLEDAGRQLTESYLHELGRVQRMSSEAADAIALLKPARPEDGLLPAVRDVMQRLVLAESIEKDHNPWKYWTKILLHAYDNDNRPNTFQIAEMRAALRSDE
jgi:hypothetical protein